MYEYYTYDFRELEILTYRQERRDYLKNRKEGWHKSTPKQAMPRSINNKPKKINRPLKLC